eukprot:630930-Pelagomonas_calceolata.AAC.9
MVMLLQHGGIVRVVRPQKLDARVMVKPLQGRACDTCKEQLCLSLHTWLHKLTSESWNTRTAVQCNARVAVDCMCSSGVRVWWWNACAAVECVCDGGMHVQQRVLDCAYGR